MAIRQKGEFQNESNKKTKRVEFSEKRIFFTRVRITGGMFVFQKIRRALFSYYFRLEFRSFALLPTTCSLSTILTQRICYSDV